MKQHWITYEAFETLHGVSTNSITSAKAQGLIPNEYVTNGFIDNKFFTRRNTFKKELIFYCQEYITLLMMKYSITEIVDSMCKYYNYTTRTSIYSYISTDIFKSDEKSIMSYKVSERLLMTARYCRKVNRALNKKHGINFCVTKELDTYI